MAGSPAAGRDARNRHLGYPVAAIDLPATDAVIGVVSFDTRVGVFEFDAGWADLDLSDGAVIVAEAFDGLVLVDLVSLPLASFSAPTVSIAVPGGMTSVVVRLSGRAGTVLLPTWMEFERARYRTVAELVSAKAHQVTCGRRSAHALDGAGRLAWLPNHEYEVALEVRVEVSHAATGAQETRVTQRAYFSTKGLPGLNAVRRLGDDIEPYVESRYGGPNPYRLYRREPVAIAFSEGFNVLVPVDRVLRPEAPAERNQLLEWTLVVEQVAGAGDAQRVSVTARTGSSPTAPSR